MSKISFLLHSLRGSNPLYLNRDEVDDDLTSHLPPVMRVAENLETRALPGLMGPEERLG